MKLSGLNKPFKLSLSSKPSQVLQPEILLDWPIPSSLAGINPRTVLGPEWWDPIRKMTYAYNNFCCLACGASEPQPLHAHEQYELDWDKNLARYARTVPLCAWCHYSIHYMGVPSYLRERVLRHSLKVLRKAQLMIESDKFYGLYIEEDRPRVECQWDALKMHMFHLGSWKLDITAAWEQGLEVDIGKGQLKKLFLQVDLEQYPQVTWNLKEVHSDQETTRSSLF